MRFRVAILAVLVFALVDFAQGLGVLGAAGGSSPRHRGAAPEAFTYQPTDDAATPPPGSAAPPADTGSPPAVAPVGVASPAPPTTIAPSTVAITSPASTTLPSAPLDATVARVLTATLPVFDSVGDVAPKLELEATTEFGDPRVLLVTEQAGPWLRVLLPVGPIGSEGWVASNTVALSTVPDVVEVDVDAHMITWTRRGVVVRHAAVGTGSPSSPTLRGTFFVTDVLHESPNGSHGAWAIVLSVHAGSATEFDATTACVAILGTNERTSIGQSSASGCVRVDADTLARLASAIAPGTPVRIH